MSCYAFTCRCFYCSRVQYGCKRDTPNKCAEHNCGLDIICSQTLPNNYYINQCKRFGKAEYDVGSCIDCSVENKNLFYACRDIMRNLKEKKVGKDN